MIADGSLPPPARWWDHEPVCRAYRVIVGHPDADPIARAAIAIYSGPVIDRAEVTARILLGQSPGDISAATGRPEAVVVLYELLAFDIYGQPRPRSVPGMDLMQAIDEDDIEAILHRAAIRGGLAMVKAVTEFFRASVNGPLSPGRPPLSARDRAIVAAYRHLIGLLILPADLVTWEESDTDESTDPSDPAPADQVGASAGA
jgi:hypothetical protein